MAASCVGCVVCSSRDTEGGSSSVRVPNERENISSFEWPTLNHRKFDFWKIILLSPQNLVTIFPRLLVKKWFMLWLILPWSNFEYHWTLIRKLNIIKCCIITRVCLNFWNAWCNLKIWYWLQNIEEERTNVLLFPTKYGRLQGMLTLNVLDTQVYIKEWHKSCSPSRQRP